MDGQNIALADKFVAAYQNLDKQDLSELKDIYHDDIVFEDPAHRVEGWGELSDYLARLFDAVDYCSFNITEQVCQGDIAYVQWVMTFQHPRLQSGKSRLVNGCSRLVFAEGKVIHHRDYFDMGQMLYEGIPLLGSVVRKIKARL
ncbi:nuclear transport factor 2 family protein [Photobacterium rosenbergii]|uniref:Nuclear transport factor 2 family protein n=1 Tax=Photobacterium rosenbergii TaxID=294936 RepID=A0ABU3ZCE5_9GAMM|nr:nuclear transport factor 2 family protein [Photobacterium rosenbergii]MDV5167648.1 nuclear transport factor 2 family protein [Photobacterium rosenbergii]